MVTTRFTNINGKKAIQIEYDTPDGIVHQIIPEDSVLFKETINYLSKKQQILKWTNKTEGKHETTFRFYQYA